MEASTSSEIDLESVESSRSNTITSYIREFVTLRKVDKTSDEKVEKLKKHMSNLIESNCNIEANLNNLEQIAFDIDAKITATTKIQIEKKQKLTDLQKARANTLHKQWSNCQSKVGNYASDFSKWITEYSNNVLMKNIEDHQKDCKETGNELAILKQEVDDVIKKFDFNYIETNMDDVDDLQNLIDSVISDIKSSNSKLMHNVRSTENAVNKIQMKIKRYKIAVNEYKTKEKTNTF